jgi:hypothetical protein
LHEIFGVLFRFVLYFILAFAAGCLLSGLFFHRQGSLGIRELDTRYTGELRGAAETAGELVEGLTDSAGRNVRNLQEAIGLIGEIRKKLAVLENFYADSGSVGGAP